MALLIVQAVAEDTIAAPGNASNSYLVVSVTDSNGAPVSGLAIANFAIGSPIVAPFGSLSHVTSASAGGSSGVYIINIVPVAGQTWKAGTYIWSVAVTRGADHGQALCSTVMD